MNETPQYAHDCETCNFLGRDVDDQSGSSVDMYFCPQHGLPTIIMRYGSNGEDYTSAPIIVINNSDVFSETPLLRNMLISEDMGLWDRKKVIGEQK